MRKLNAKPLTADAFRKYGTYSRMINPDGERLGPPPVAAYIARLAALEHLSEAEFRAHL